MQQHGFILLFAMLTSTILLSVGLALSNISYKEIVLASASRDSQYAFFGSDSGSECAFYWDRKWFEHGLPNSPFPENDSPDAIYPDGETVIWSEVKCSNREVTDTSVSGWEVVSSATGATTTFRVRLGPTDRDGCVTVRVGKNLPAGNNLPDVKITASGASSCSDTDPRVVERTIESDIPGF